MRILILLVPRWSLLQRIGGSKIVGMTAFIPFVGYLLILNEKVSQYVSLLTDSLFDGIEEHVPRLLDIYVGLVFLAFAVIILKLFSPAEFRIFSRRNDFVNYEKDIVTRAEINSLRYELKGILKFFYSSRVIHGLRVANQTTFIESVNELSTGLTSGSNTILSRATWLKENEESIIEVLKTVYDVRNENFIFARLFCALCFSFGYILLSLPALRIFFEIILG